MAVGDGEEPIILYLVYKGTGNELTLIFDYLKEGATDREQLSQTLFLALKKKKNKLPVVHKPTRPNTSRISELWER